MTDRMTLSTIPYYQDDVVISGIAGIYPESNDIRHLGENLLAKKDLVSEDERRWKFEHPEIPQRTGKIAHVNKFDAAFFGIHAKQAHAMDPMSRLLLEKSYEAIVDAGYNPKQLKGSKTGVFVGACFSESERRILYESRIDGCGMTGCSRAMFANRISYWLDINGPSYTMDTACSSSLYALEHGYKAIKCGDCDAAIVGGCNLCLHPYISLQYARLGVLSLEGKCKSFDETADGYCRSEAVVVVLLQKLKNARRVYAKVVHAKTNCDGYTEEGITHPSLEQQTRLLKEFYNECRVDASGVDYVEAHGTGTQVGDPIEVKSIETILCGPQRCQPLKIGSIKSNIGHCEAASGLCGVSKVILSFELDVIPPNLHLETLRLSIEAFHNGKIQVITEPTPLNGRLAAVNNFGFGGANAHVLLESFVKTGNNAIVASDKLPRLVVASGRTEEAVDVILNDFEGKPVNVEYIRLMHEIQSEEIPGHLYRGYTILSQNGERERHIENFSGEKRPIWFVFSGMGSQWPTMGSSLLDIPVCAAALYRCHDLLKHKDVDLIDIITKNDPTVYDNILNSFVGIAAIQIALVDLLNALKVVPDGIVGHSVGELGCAYADGCFTAEQMIMAAYYRGKASVETEFIHGTMASIGLGHEEVFQMLPAEIEVACHNAPNNCTISGPTEDVSMFVASLKEKDIFAREINVSNIAYHSRYIAQAAPKIFSYMKKVIPKPLLRGEKWICTSAPESEWDLPQARYSAAEYYTNNLLNPVYFEEACRHIPDNAIVFEIAPHGLLQAILKRSLTDSVTNIPLTQKNHPNNALFLIKALGKFYEAGGNPKLYNLYPPVEFPVSKGTPMISPLIRWEHSQDWFTSSHHQEKENQSGGKIVNVSLKEDTYKYLFGHLIDGRNLFPATGYLMLAWETLSEMRGQRHSDVAVVFENVRFERPTNLPKEGDVIFNVNVQKGSGNFEIMEKNTTLVSGRIYVPEEVDSEFAVLPAPSSNDGAVEPAAETFTLTTADVYKELRLRGYNYKGLFKGVTYVNNKGTSGRILWKNNFVTFLDNMLQLKILREDTRNLVVPVSIQKLVIDPKKHSKVLENLNNEKPEFPIHIHPELDLILSGGIEIRNMKTSSIVRKSSKGKLVLENYKFIPYSYPKVRDFEELIRCYVHVAIENLHAVSVKLIEIVDESNAIDDPLISRMLVNIFEDFPTVQANINIYGRPDHYLLANKIEGINECNKTLPNDESCSIIVALHALADIQKLHSCLHSLKPNGFLLTLKEKPIDLRTCSSFGLNVCFECKHDGKEILLLRKNLINQNEEDTAVIEITNNSFTWVTKIQQELELIDHGENRKIIIFAEKEKYSGILGFFKCIQKEFHGKCISCFLISDSCAPKFSIHHPFYRAQLAKKLTVNIFKDGQWGSYRHLLLRNRRVVKTSHAIISTLVRGDLSTLQWIEGSINPKLDDNENLVYVYYAPLNFRDIMMATGKLPPETIIKSRLQGEFTQGFEYTGKLQNGQRVMGMVAGRSIATMIECDPHLMWNIPDEWTLEEAATIPVVYATVLYALQYCGRIRPGETILIHAGSGGIGQAAINICLHYGCEIFTTVGTNQKREFIKNTFPSILDDHIGSSRDTSFEELIMKKTRGRGVDLVLNSLAADKLQASVRCLGNQGRFLEIGRADIAMNSMLGMEHFAKECTFCSVLLDHFFYTTDQRKLELKTLLENAIAAGIVKPLIRTVFNDDEVEAAFRYMTSGKHIGKVILKIRNEEPELNCKPEILLKDAIPRYSCNQRSSYVLCGGLGGFGLELADWLILRGAKNVILTSRKGIRTGYQAWRIQLWRSYGVNVLVCVNNMTTDEEVKKLLLLANEQGPVVAIFNLAVVLQDALFENQSLESFSVSWKPKADATLHLDKLSRKLCPRLEHFVVFSSIICGYGNAGQTNYGMANSVIERICEIRRAEGLPALAIEWGAIADVGLVAEMAEDREIVVGGTLPQSLLSCLNTLDYFMKQSHPIVSCMVVAEKDTGVKKTFSLTDKIANILGIKNLKTISFHTPLAELGADSMMNTEIKQLLDREFKTYLSMHEIRRLTFTQLEELVEVQKNVDGSPEKEKGRRQSISSDAESEIGKKYFSQLIEDDSIFHTLIQRIPSALHDYATHEIPTADYPTVFLMPGVEGIAKMMEPLSKNLHVQVLCLQYGLEAPFDLHKLVSTLLKHISDRIAADEEFFIVGYSFGGLIAMEIVKLLEAENRRGKLWLIDSSPDFLKVLAGLGLRNESEDALQCNIINQFLDMMWPGVVNEITDELFEINDWDDKLEFVITRIFLDFECNKEHLKSLMTARYLRVKAALNHRGFRYESFNTVTKLICPSERSVPASFAKDYGLSKYFKNPVRVNFVSGNHFSILKNKKVAELIMEGIRRRSIRDS